MSALGSKAERQPKSRFQSLDINNLYCTSRGESVEQLTQKSSVPRKHGMQSLGKVPTARRPPANLPSIRAEATTPTLGQANNDQASWGSDNKNTPSTTQSPASSAPPSQQPQQVQPGQQQQQPQQQQAPAGPQPNQPQQPATTGQPQPTNNTASWSAVAVGSGGVGLSDNSTHGSYQSQQPPSYQSPQFQHEFPSLDGHTPNVTSQKPGPDAQYGPGPSLRPQTEGSWIGGGGSRGNPTENSVAPNSGAVGAPMGGPVHQAVHPQFQAIMPSFMYRGSGGGTNNFGLPQNFGSVGPQPITARTQGRPQNNYNDGPRDNNRRGPPPKREIDMTESPLQRPIIKEEDLDKMEDIARDVGWAAHDDIDYNQKLAFSDDESPEPTPPPASTNSNQRESTPQQSTIRILHSHSAPPAEIQREQSGNNQQTQAPTNNQRQISPAPQGVTKMKSGSIEKSPEEGQVGQGRGLWGAPRDRQPDRQHEYRQNGHPRGGNRGTMEDEEVWIQRRKQTTERIERAQELAKLRREEEDRKFMETKMAATKKLHELEQKISAKKNSSSDISVHSKDSLSEMNPAQSPESGTNEGLDFRQMSQIGNGASTVASVTGRGFVPWSGNSEPQSAGGDRDHHRESEPRVILDRSGSSNSHERDSRNGSNSRDLDGGGGPPPRQDGGGGGGGGAPNFSKQFQIDLPPRFRNQAEKNHTRASGNNDKSNNVPFAQQYDTRWVHPPSQNYTKSSSMGGGPGMSRRAPSVDDVGPQGGGQPRSQQYSRHNSSTHSLNRSMSDTSQRKLSVGSSEDRSSTTSSHNQLDTSTPKAELKTSESCREFGSSWADEPLENEKLLYGSGKDSDGKHKDSDSSGNEMVKLSDKPWGSNDQDKKSNELITSNKQIVEITQVTLSQKTDGGMKTDKEMVNDDFGRNRDGKRTSPKTGSRTSGTTGRGFGVFRRGEQQQMGTGSAGGVRKPVGTGGRPGRVGTSGHSGGDHAWSETDGSEEHEDDRKKGGRRSPKQQQHHHGQSSNQQQPSQQQQNRDRDQHHQQQSGHQQHSLQQRSTSSGSLKQQSERDRPNNNMGGNNSAGGRGGNLEGFAPRGEPSRRGRGSAYRSSRGAMKNVDYGPPRRAFGGSTDPEKTRDPMGVAELTSDDRTKLKQQALSAGIGISTTTTNTSGNIRGNNPGNKSAPRMRSGGRSKGPSKGQGGAQSDEAWETTSDHSEAQDSSGNQKRNQRTAQPRVQKNRNNERKNSTGSQQVAKPAGPVGAKQDQQHEAKKSPDNTNNANSANTTQQNTNTNKKGTLEGIDLHDFASVVVIDEQPEKSPTTTSSSCPQSSSDGDGFQEVRNKKAGKKADEPAQSNNQQQSSNNQQQQGNQQQQQQRSSATRQTDKKERSSSKGNKPVPSTKPPTTVPTSSAQQPQQPPPPLQQPQNNQTSTKNQSERPRQSKLPPRLARQKENIRMQRAQAQDLNVMAPMPTVNAWDKPITASLRTNMDQDSPMNLENDVSNITTESGNSSQRSTPGTNIDPKLLPNSNKPGTDPKSGLDGTTPPVQTIIFENTNYKTGPTQQQQPVKRTEKQRENDIFKSVDMMDTTPTSANQLSGLQLSFQKSESDYDKDMKLSFNFESDLAQLTEDKNTKSLGLPRSMHSVSSSSQSTISPSTAELNLKIQSVKKVWENAPVMPTVLEQSTNEDSQHNLSSPHNLSSQHSISAQHNLNKHQNMNQNLSVQNQINQHNLANQAHSLTQAHNLSSQHNLVGQHNLSPAATYASTFGSDPSGMEHFGKSDSNDNEGVYSPSPQHVTPYNHVPQMNKHNDMSGGGNNVCKVKQPQNMHPSGLGAISGSQGLGLSPPPALQANALQATPQQYYQASQFGNMSAIPSPPAVLFNSSQPILGGASQMPVQSQQGLYGTFQMEQNRSAYSQFPGHYAGANAPYNYMQSAPSLPPATPDMYQSLSSQYRAMGGAPFGQSQQLNNPSTVLISSTSNSLMSASVKPSNQIGAIGSKSGSHYSQPYVGVAYPPQAALQSSSYYGGGTAVGGGGAVGGAGGGPGGFYQPQGGAVGAGAPGGFSLAANMFNNNQPPPPPPQQQPVQSFGSQFLSSPLLAATMQQYRGPQSGYLKNQGPSHLPDPCSRPLKSPIGESLGQMKQIQPQSSPPQHKSYPSSVMQQPQQQVNSSNSGAGGQRGGSTSNSNAMPRGSHNNGTPLQVGGRYLAPIQRPTQGGGYQQQSGHTQQQRAPRHNQAPPMKSYYTRGPHGNPGHNDQNVNKPNDKNDCQQINNSTDVNKDDTTE